MRRSSAGAVLRALVAFTLSYIDLGTRIAAIVFFFSEGLVLFAAIQITILIFNFGVQSLLVWLTNQPRLEYVYIWTSTKMGMEIFRGVRKVPRPTGILYSSQGICTFTRLADIGSESILSALFQAYVLSTLPVWNPVSIFALVSSLGASAYTVADAHFDMDADAHSRSYDFPHNALL